jgi:WD40 repeat protein
MPRLIVMRMFAGAVALGLLTSCGGSGSGTAPLTITAASPPAGTTGAAFPGYSFQASGGTPPFIWNESGPMPPGLMLSASGQLSGMPATAGTYPVSVTVTDSSYPPVTATAAVTLTVNDPPTINAAEPLTGTVGLMYVPFQFTVSDGLAPPLAWLETPLLSGGLSLSSDGILSGTPTAAGQFPITLNVTDARGQSASPVPVVVRVSLPHSGSFTVLSASMTAPRSGHTATLLTSGKVLIAGGANGAADASAELYDPATGAFTATGSMTEARTGHTATLLNDSARSVLIVGSVDMTAELYNPATGTFTATGSMHHARTSPTATLLSNTGPNAGKVLVVGGNTASGDLVAELYDPGTGTFTDTGSTTIVRSGHTATLLTTSPLAGQVLIAGGSDSASAELYNPATGLFTKTGDMTVTRSGHTATELGTQDGAQNGDVLIVGTDGSADLYDPSKGTFARIGSLLPPMQTSNAHTANLRSDGTVLAAGGYGFGGSRGLICAISGTAAALFAPESDGFTATGSLGTRRDSHTATVLADGTVLIVGGTEHSGCLTGAVVLSSAELFK